MKKTFQILAAVFVLLAGIAKAQKPASYEASTFVTGIDTLPYRILFPEKFNASKKYPLLIVLHGSGERGNDNQAQLVHGGDLFLKDSVRKDFPAIVVFPQCPKDGFWSNVIFKTDSLGKRYFDFPEGGEPTKSMSTLIGLVGKLRDKPFVDEDRVYVGGLSMGGMGTLDILKREPKWFAAGFVICGGDNPANVKKYRKIPLWFFHGAKDDVVAPEYSKVIVDELKKRKADVQYTIYPNDNHNSWDSAFAEPGFLPWLFSNKK
ncbi:prolyl oligopeptidase family serine peptidase [Pedobacter sp. HMF7647]|uniref:Prolyl oligopeptidase family serine peptidase n=1 Tax=Hufsiella arboris TaxID=2695275 RepID=A0A7K1YEK9_9SPHI|nr:prolyl oligopeptidase family serine peptidase [Hufsiella arboris]MXV53044.1 prolyl oligopeptidase family serine peptidase [Hufsiella arboris]